MEPAYNPRVLSQLLLMQNVMVNLPNKKTIMGFVCHGLKDIPGVDNVEFKKKGCIRNIDTDQVLFAVGKDMKFGCLLFTIADINIFSVYQDYLRNFIFMTEVILEEREQRELIKQQQTFLEKRVEERTRQLTNEIEERKQVEETLKESFRLLRLAGEKMNLGGWTVNIETNTLFWSDQVAFIHGMPAGYTPTLEEAIRFYAPAWREKISEVFNLCAQKGIPYDEEMQIIRPDGKLVWVRTIGEAVKNSEGKISKVQGAFQDITEKKMADEALRQAEITREAGRMKQNFLANMSHEMRTPLTGILGMIEIFEQTDLTESQKDYLDTLKISGENLKEIINQVLDFSKIEAGKISLNPIAFNPATTLRNLEKALQNMVRDGVRMSFLFNPKLPDCIVADKTRIIQVVNNLVSNALKFTKQGEVIVTVNVESNHEKENCFWLRFEVKDTGIGIPSKLLGKLFLPFSQIEENDTRLHEGTGLGLSISKELVNLMGGKIGVESEYRKGSTFWFTIPVKTLCSETETSEKATELFYADKTLRILLAEDKLVNQKVMMLLLQSLGHQVTVANHGKEVLELFHPDKFDLILMDIQMPVMDGITATCLLKDQYKNILPPIVGLSANAFDGDREKYMSQGLDEYLTKPIKKEDLVKMINQLIKR